ncbi:MAG: hypothetical protein CVV44_18615 [Spirochaetae bacterium HGW-Spirochaetae-1]|jgi:hypothetical protein|nr:MAG: hypothetical protein CVV44_18615 [Spirochaetae bacterium HGW-Spirochaetae-1]
MKKTLSFIVLIFLAITVTFAGEKAPVDLKDASRQVMSIMDNYCQALQSVKSARDYARAIHQYTDEMVKIAPQLRAIEVKYGRFEVKKKADQTEMELFRKYQRDMEKALSDERVEKAQRVNAKYNGDPQVQKAFDRLNSAMEKALGFSGDGE